MALYWTFVLGSHLDRVEEEKKAAAKAAAKATAAGAIGPKKRKYA